MTWTFAAIILCIISNAHYASKERKAALEKLEARLDEQNKLLREVRDEIDFLRVE
jgi:large-conductance mechanosensitive channel